jgi:hypothetical protein
MPLSLLAKPIRGPENEPSSTHRSVYADPLEFVSLYIAYALLSGGVVPVSRYSTGPDTRVTVTVLAPQVGTTADAGTATSAVEQATAMRTAAQAAPVRTRSMKARRSTHRV